MVVVEPAGTARSQQSHASSEPEQPAQAAATELESTPATPHGEPVRNVHLQLSGENNQRVDIRLTDVGGEMRVSVRAGDTKLAQTLQDHIPELANRLDQQRFRAEIWSPRTQSASQSDASNLGRESSSRGNDSPGQNNQGRQQNGRQKNQPDWLDEFEGYSSRNQKARSN